MKTLLLKNRYIMYGKNIREILPLFLVNQEKIKIKKTPQNLQITEPFTFHTI
jgi:hypothetical protein